MISRNLKKLKPVLLLGILTINADVSARIMDDDEARLADTSLLQTEAKMFQNIRQGMTLTQAYCAGTSDCETEIDAAEVERLLSKLNSRINDLTLRQESAEDPIEFEQVLSLYVDERDNYTALLQEIEPLDSDLQEIAEETEVEFEEAEPVFAEEAENLDSSEQATDVISEDVESFDFLEDGEDELKDDADIGNDDFDPTEF